MYKYLLIMVTRMSRKNYTIIFRIKLYFRDAIIALFFQVLDEDLVADTVCDANKDCQAPNARFREKCEAYRDCGNSSEPVFQCDSTFRRCLSVRQTRNCKYYILSHYYYLSKFGKYNGQLSTFPAS